MNLDHVTFTGAIRSASSELGRTPTEDQVNLLNDMLQCIASRDEETGAFTVATGGDPMPLADYIAEQVGRFPKLVTAAPVPAGLLTALDRIQADADRGILRVGSGVQQGRPRGDAFADIVRGLEARHQAALAAELATYPNPWLPGQINRTHQVIITKADPARAAQYRAEAGL